MLMHVADAYTHTPSTVLEYSVTPLTDSTGSCPSLLYWVLPPDWTDDISGVRDRLCAFQCFTASVNLLHNCSNNNNAETVKLCDCGGVQRSSLALCVKYDIQQDL